MIFVLAIFAGGYMDDLSMILFWTNLGIIFPQKSPSHIHDSLIGDLSQF